MNYDEVVAYIREWNREFNGSGRVDEPRIINGISFWRVGWNASHEFYAGVGPDGRLYQRAIGEKCPTREEADDPDFVSDLEESIREVTDFNGYYGHF